MGSPAKRKRHPVKPPKHSWTPRNPTEIPETSIAALRQAVSLEEVPADQFNDLAWIMAQESGGIVNATNRHSTARGLFQLLRAGYEYTRTEPPLSAMPWKSAKVAFVTSWTDMVRLRLLADFGRVINGIEIIDLLTCNGFSWVG